MIHSTAVIDKNAIIENDVEIGPYVIIGQKSIVKSGTKIHGHSVIEYAEIGNNCEIFNFCSIGKAPQDLKYNKEKTKIIIGDGTIIREYATLNRGTVAFGQTVIGKNCLIMCSAHIAHDCIIGNNVIVGYSTGLAGHVEVGDFAVLSSSVGIHQFCKIGQSVMIGAGSMVSMDIIPYVIAQGDRASLIGLNFIGMRRQKISSLEINNVKYAYRILFMSKLLLTKALEKINQSESVYVQEIVNFIKVSKRGIVRPK